MPKSYDISNDMKKKYGEKESKRWSGWKNTLKPCWEPIILMRNPPDGTIIDNLLKYNTGAINIKDNRIGDHLNKKEYGKTKNQGQYVSLPKRKTVVEYGSYPSNIMLTEPGTLGSTADKIFLVPKAGNKERYGFCVDCNRVYSIEQTWSNCQNHDIKYHPTVKPLSLMRHLVRLITPTSGTVLDPFMGTGTTAISAKMEGFNWIGCDKMPEFVEIAKFRLKNAQNKKKVVGWS